MICLEEQIEAYLEQIMKDLLNTYNLELIDKHIDIYHMLLSLKKKLVLCHLDNKLLLHHNVYKISIWKSKIPC